MKPSFLLHKDSLLILKKLSDEQAGKLFKAIAQYQTEGTVPELDFALDLAILPFINQFKRDEESYQKVVDRNQKNGQSGGRPAKEPKKPSGLSGNPKNPSKPKKPDSVKEKENVNENDIDTPSALENRRNEFYQTVFAFAQRYDELMLNKFYRYWSQQSMHDKTKLGFETEKMWDTESRLQSWKENENQFQSKSNQKVNGHAIMDSPELNILS